MKVHLNVHGDVHDQVVEIFRLWLACHTEEEIAAKMGMSQKTVSDVLAKNETFRFPLEPGLFTDLAGDERLNATCATS